VRTPAAISRAVGSSLLWSLLLTQGVGADDRDRSSVVHDRERSSTSQRETPISAPANCDRACLEHLVDQYLEAVVAHDPTRLPLAAHVRFTEMGQELELGDGFWHTASAAGHYRHYFPDPTVGQVGFMGTMRENGTLVMMALRLRVQAGRISDIETLFYRQGSGPAWNDAGVEQAETKASVDPVWFEPLASTGRASREQLADIANAYFTGIEHNDGKGSYPFSDDCERIENGMQTTGNPALTSGAGFNFAALGCLQQFRSGYLAVVTRVHHRRFMAIDAEHGVVFTFVNFDQAGVKSVKLTDGRVIPTPVFAHPSSIELAEAFKIENGLIRRVEAVGSTVPYRMSPGWEESAVAAP
jgi:hypothetical protein